MGTLAKASFIFTSEFQHFMWSQLSVTCDVCPIYRHCPDRTWAHGSWKERIGRGPVLPCNHENAFVMAAISKAIRGIKSCCSFVHTRYYSSQICHSTMSRTYCTVVLWYYQWTCVTFRIAASCTSGWSICYFVSCDVPLKEINMHNKNPP